MGPRAAGAAIGLRLLLHVLPHVAWGRRRMACLDTHRKRRGGGGRTWRDGVQPAVMQAAPWSIAPFCRAVTMGHPRCHDGSRRTWRGGDCTGGRHRRHPFGPATKTTNGTARRHTRLPPVRDHYSSAASFFAAVVPSWSWTSRVGSEANHAKDRHASAGMVRRAGSPPRSM